MDNFKIDQISTEGIVKTFDHIHGVMRVDDSWLIVDGNNPDFSELAKQIKDHNNCIWAVINETWATLKDFLIMLGFKKIGTDIFRNYTTNEGIQIRIYGSYFLQNPKDAYLRHFFPLPEIDKETIRPIMIEPFSVPEFPEYYERFLKDIEDLFPSQSSTAFYSVVNPGVTIKKSVQDYKTFGTTFGKFMRFIIPIETNGQSKFISWNLEGGQEVTAMQPGDCFYIDARKPHSIINKGKTPRIDLILDFQATIPLIDFVMNRNWVTEYKNDQKLAVDSNDVVIDWNEDVGYAR